MTDMNASRSSWKAEDLAIDNWPGLVSVEREESCLIIIIIEVFCLSDYISPGTTLLNALFFTALKGSLN